MVTKRDHEDSAHRTIMRVRDYVMLAGFCLTVIFGLVAGYIDIGDRLDSVEEDVSEAKAVHLYLILQARHTSKTIRHIVPAERRDELPKPPPELRAAELELLP